MCENQRQSAVEEHIVLIGEPGTKYLSYVVPKSGTAIDLNDAILNFIGDRSSGLDVMAQTPILEKGEV